MIFFLQWKESADLSRKSNAKLHNINFIPTTEFSRNFLFFHALIPNEMT